MTSVGSSKECAHKMVLHVSTTAGMRVTTVQYVQADEIDNQYLKRIMLSSHSLVSVRRKRPASTSQQITRALSSTTMILEECPRCSGEEKSCMQLMYIGAMSPLMKVRCSQRERASDLVLKLCAVQYATNFGVNILVTQRCVCQPSLCGDTTHTDDFQSRDTVHGANASADDPLVELASPARESPTSNYAIKSQHSIVLIRRNEGLVRTVADPRS